MLYIKCQKLPCITCRVFCTGGGFSEPVVGVLLCRSGYWGMRIFFLRFVWSYKVG